MMTLLLIGIFVTELVKYGIWFMGIRGLPLKRWRAGGIISGICILLIGIGIINQNSPLFLWGIADIIIFSIMIECEKVERGLLIGQAFFVILSLGEILGEIIQILSDVPEINVKRTTYLFCNVIIIFMLIILYAIKRWVRFSKILKIEEIYRRVIYGIIILMNIVILLVVTGLQNIARTIEDNGINTFARIISIVAYLCIVCLAMMISYILNENKRYKLYLEKEALLVKLQKGMYESMLSKNEETRRFRHDIQNHFICLNELAKCGEICKVQNYIAEIAGKLHAIQGKMYTVGNSVVDVVLNYYISMLPSDVKVNVIGICPSDIRISDFELCTIISNIIKNAEEALKKEGIKERYLQIEFGDIENYVWMKTKNSIAEKSVVIDSDNKLPKTTKNDERMHGMGMHNIRETIEKNGGILNIEVNENEFSVMVMLPAS